jgi:CheY-like chemotaxis protein
MTAPKEPPRALIVEHDEAVRQMLILAMESLGFTAVPVSSGDAALEAVEGQVLAIAIVESRLPGALSGAETLEALKLQLPSLPVILMSEPERPADVLAAFHAGASDVLLKPFELADLRAALARALVKRSDEIALDFHGRVELAKTALASGAFAVAGAHLRGALGQNPLDAEVLNLYGVSRELDGDVGAATQAYRAAFACDPGYGHARENLERVSDQFTYIGLLADARLDLFQATPLRIAVPIFEPVRDLPLVRAAKLLGGPSCGVALGVLFDPPTEEGGAVRTIARRRGFVRGAGRKDPGSVPAIVDYAFTVDRVAAARRLREAESCEWTLVGAWTPEIVRNGIAGGGATVLVARAVELEPIEGVLPETLGELALGIAVNLAVTARAPVLLPAPLVETIRVSTLSAHALFSHAKVRRPTWVQSEAYVSVQAADEKLPAITIGAAEGSTIRIV